VSLLSRIGRRLGLTRQSGVSSSAELADLLRIGAETRSGVPMSPLTALGVATVLACVRVIAEGLGTLPCALARRTEDGSEPVTTIPPAWILDTPNDWMTWQEIVETLTMHAALAGNGFAWVQRGALGQPLAILPLMPGWVMWKQEADWSIRYRVTWPDGRQQEVPFADMLHLRGPSWDAVGGLQVVQMAREAIGLAAAMEWVQAQHFGKGGQPSGYLTTERPSVTEEQATEWKRRWRAMYGGQEAGGVAVLANGAKFVPLTFDFVSAQTLEARRMQVEEICRAFRVFPQMIGANDKASTYASAEAFFTAHAVHTLGPWARRWEQTLGRDLLSERQRATMFYTMDMRGLMRADAKSRSEFYAKALGSGGSPAWMTPNEVRAAEGLNRQPGLDEVPRPVATLPAATGEPAAAAPDPAQPAPA
jgi:HK97 family phage portal protein